MVTTGSIVGLKLPVGLFPRVSFPRVVVSLEAGDRPANEMAVLVTVPVEAALRAVPAVRSVRSTTSRGSAEISINFDWGTNMEVATLQIEAALGQVTSSLGTPTTYDVRRMDPTVFPVLAYSLTSNQRSPTELYDLAFYQLRPRLSTVNGVSSVAVVGGAPEEIHVVTSPERLARFHLTTDDIAKALADANALIAAGPLEADHKLYLVLSDARPHTLEDLANVVVRPGIDGLVRLEDVAVVSRTAVPQRTVVTADGRDAVLFQVYQQPGGNTVQIAHDVEAALAAAGDVVPQDVHLANWYDQSQLILASAKSVRDAILIGIGLAMLVLFAFLRDARVTLIAAVVVPSVLGATSLVLGVLGQSFNLMTLGGMAAAVGLIIDDAIVVVEHISRRLGEREDPSRTPSRALILANAFEFTRPLAGSSAGTIVIFLPLTFLTGVTGAFFKALSLTMASALVISFFIAWLVVPHLAVWFLRQGRALMAEGDGESRFFGAYGRVLGGLLRRPALGLLLAIPFLLLGYLGYRSTGSGFMPSTDEGGFVLDYRSAPGTSLAETDRLLRQLEGILARVPEVETYSRRTGIQLGGGLTEANEGDFFIRLKPLPRRSIEAVMDDVRGQIETRVPGLEVELLQLMEDLIGDLTAVPQPIEIKLFGADGETLAKVAEQVAARISKLPGVVDVNDGVVPAGDALVARIDGDRAAVEGVSPQAIGNDVANQVGGIVATSLPENDKNVDVRVWTPELDRSSVADVGRLRITAPDGHTFPLQRVATIERVSGQAQIARDDLKRIVAVTGRISGRDLGSTIKDVRSALASPGLLPAGVSYSLGGLYEQQQIAFKGLIQVLALSLVLVYLVLLFLYESFRVATVLLLPTLFAFAAVYLGLWVTGIEMNISSMMGLTMIVGIVTEVSIFYFSEYRELSEIEDRQRRLVMAGKNRMRPIAMTTLAAMLALMPLALGLGEGSGMLTPLAIAIEFGLAAQMPVVLVLLPVMLSVTGAE
ncbi:MAG: efflux RND transporter permease subunit [Acidobacteria bacterium]|nr:efflux RND transporter permease subunit [Acidobacteriota bacterium]